MPLQLVACKFFYFKSGQYHTSLTRLLRVTPCATLLIKTLCCSVNFMVLLFTFEFKCCLAVSISSLSSTSGFRHSIAVSVFCSVLCNAMFVSGFAFTFGFKLCNAMQCLFLIMILYAIQTLQCSIYFCSYNFLWIVFKFPRDANIVFHHSKIKFNYKIIQQSWPKI